MFDILSDNELKEVYTLIANKKAGFEINMPFHLYKTDEERTKAIRPYILAKECGCKFYLGSDAHHPDALDGAYDNFSKIVKLKQTEKDIVLHYYIDNIPIKIITTEIKLEERQVRNLKKRALEKLAQE